MLPSLRSAVIRSLSLHSRSFTSEANQEVMNQLFHDFGSTPSTPQPEVSTTPPAATDTKPKPFYLSAEVPPAQDPLLEFFASRMMERGHRARAEKSTAEVLMHIHALTKVSPLPILRQAVELAAPAVRVMRHKSGGKVLIKPVALNERQRTKKAIDWILDASKSRVGYTRGERVARECVRVLQGSSSVLEKKVEQHKLAMVSRGNVPRMR